MGAILFFQDDGRSISGFMLYELKGITTTGVHGIYWYVYMIIGLYCLTPVLRYILHSNGRSGGGILLYLCVLCLIVAVLGNALPEFQLLSHWVSKNLTMLFYFMAGWLISNAINTKYKEFDYKRFWGILLAVVYVISIVASYCKVEVPGLSILLSVSLFGFLMTIPMTVGNSKVCKVVYSVSKYSYGIYLSHFMLISAMVKMSVFSRIPIWIEPLMMASIVLTVDACFMYIMDKMKLGKYVF